VVTIRTLVLEDAHWENNPIREFTHLHSGLFTEPTRLHFVAGPCECSTLPRFILAWQRYVALTP
jgi:hypothetical protein